MSDHPAGPSIGVGRAPIWYGREVEGVLARGPGVCWTAFLDAPISGRELATFRERLRQKVGHVFLTEPFAASETALAWFGDWVLPQLEDARRRIHLTIATAPEGLGVVLALPWAQRARVMVRANMDAPWISKLRPGDMVTVGVPYDLVTWEMRDGVRSVPSDYEEDEL